MDDVMILLHRFMIDIQGFNEKHFLVFEEHEQAQLLNIWNQIKNDNLPVNKFLGILSPHQKYKVVKWGLDRTSYEISEVINALEKFTKFLKKYKKPTRMYH